MNKYRNKPTVVDGHRFPSRKEAQRYSELRLMERAGIISDLQLQVSFPIHINGQRVTSYRADFVYQESGRRVVEDSKGYSNRLYLLKRKMMKAQYDIDILET